MVPLVPLAVLVVHFQHLAADQVVAVVDPLEGLPHGIELPYLLHQALYVAVDVVAVVGGLVVFGHGWGQRARGFQVGNTHHAVTEVTLARCSKAAGNAGKVGIQRFQLGGVVGTRYLVLAIELRDEIGPCSDRCITFAPPISWSSTVGE